MLAGPRYLDPDVLKEYCESGGATARKNFQDSLLQRDGSCIFREANLDEDYRMDMSEAKLARAVYFIPRCKGDEVRQHIFLM